MRAAQTPVSTKKCANEGRGRIRPARIRWYFVQALQWNDHDIDKATAALCRSGYEVTAAEVVEVVKVSCGPRQIDPIEFSGDPLVIDPGRNGLDLRMAAARALAELARRGNAG